MSVRIRVYGSFVEIAANKLSTKSVVAIRTLIQGVSRIGPLFLIAKSDRFWTKEIRQVTKFSSLLREEVSLSQRALNLS